MNRAETVEGKIICAAIDHDAVEVVELLYGCTPRERDDLRDACRQLADLIDHLPPKVTGETIQALYAAGTVDLDKIRTTRTRKL